MESFLYSPGPAHVPRELLDYMAQEPLNHHSSAFRTILKACGIGLQQVFRTEGDVAVLTASGSGAMEAAVLNTALPGSRVICVEGGKFGRRWSKICRSAGIVPLPLSIEPGESLEPDTLAQTLKANPDITAVFLTHVETSTGALFDLHALADSVKSNSDALLVADIICSLAVEPFLQDEWGVDVAVAASQKGLSCPPGLAFVSVTKESRGRLVAPQSLYWSLNRYLKTQPFGKSPFTPAVNNIVTLEAGLRRILDRGLEAIWEETKRLAGAFRGAVVSAGLEIFPARPAAGLTVIKLPNGISDREVIDRLEENYGFRIAGGQEELAGGIIRVAHMGAVGYEELRRLIAPLFETLKDSGHICDTRKIQSEFERGYYS